MAEYINKEKLLEQVIEVKLQNIHREIKVVTRTQIEDTPPADVVEKSTIMDLIKRGWSAENIITEIMRD